MKAKEDYDDIERQMPEISEAELAKIKQSQNILNLTLDLISKGDEILSKQTADEAILLIGRTGVGKSTLVNYLANPKNMHATYYKDPKAKWGKGKLVLDIKDKGDSLANIGHKMNSETTIPNRWEGNKVLYWDCPGFDHTDNPETTISQDIANAFFIKKIFDVTQNVKVLLVLTWDDLNATRADKIKAITDQLGNLFQGKDFEKILQGLSLVVTKSQGQDIDDIKGKLDEAVSSECFKGKSAGKHIIEYLLESEDRISTFDIPKQEGAIFEGENEKILGNTKWEEMTKIIQQAKFVEKPQVNIAVAKDSLLAVEDIAKAINNKVVEVLSDVCESVEKNYKLWASNVVKSADSVDVITNLMDFLSILGRSVDKLIIESSESKTIKTFVEQVQQKLVDNPDVKVDKAAFQELLKNVEYIEFFKQISKNAEKNVRLDEWITQFKDFNKALYQNIDATKGELQAKFNDGDVSLERFIDQLKLYTEELSGECFKSKNYSKYKDYIKSFEELSSLMNSEHLKFGQVVDYLEQSVLKAFNFGLV